MIDLDKFIEEQITSIAKVAPLLPSVVIIHNIQKQFAVEYMSPRGLEKLDVSLEKIKSLEGEYIYEYFNKEDASYYAPRIMELLLRNDMDEVFTFFQQVRPGPDAEWEWYCSSIKILSQTPDEQPLLTICFATPLDPQNHITQRVERLFEENMFLRRNYVKYATLSPREKEILLHLAQMKSNKEIAGELFISPNTVETHRKNIKRKLGISSSAELNQFARSFDLI